MTYLSQAGSSNTSETILEKSAMGGDGSEILEVMARDIVLFTHLKDNLENRP